MLTFKIFCSLLCVATGLFMSVVALCYSGSIGTPHDLSNGEIERFGLELVSLEVNGVQLRRVLFKDHYRESNNSRFNHADADVNIVFREHYLGLTQDPSLMTELVTMPRRFGDDPIIRGAYNQLATIWRSKFLRLTQDKNLIDKYDEIIARIDDHTNHFFRPRRTDNRVGRCSDWLLADG